MAEEKRRRRSIVEAEVMEQAQQLAKRKRGNGQPPGNPSVQQMASQIVEHQRKGQVYHDGIPAMLVEYFASADAWWTNYNDSGTGKILPKGKIPTFERFAANNGFSKFTMYDWCEKHPEFAMAYAEATELQKAFIMEGAAANAIPAQFAMFMLKCNHGMVEPQAGDNDGDNDDVTMKVHGKGQNDA